MQFKRERLKKACLTKPLLQALSINIFPAPSKISRLASQGRRARKCAQRRRFIPLLTFSGPPLNSNPQTPSAHCHPSMPTLAITRLAQAASTIETRIVPRLPSPLGHHVSRRLLLLLNVMKKAAVIMSETPVRMSRIVPGLARVADSVFLDATKCAGEAQDVL